MAHLPDSDGTTDLLAWINVDSLQATVRGSAADLGRQLRESELGQPLPELVRAYLHERVHLYQSLTTTFGLYPWLLQAAQTLIVGFLMHRLVHRCQVPLKSPLREYVRTNGHWNTVKDLVQQWDWLEAAISELTATPSYFALAHGPGLSLAWPEQFRFVQLVIDRLYRGNVGPDEVQASLVNEPLRRRDDDMPENLLNMERAFVPEMFSLVAVMESAAYAYELAGWGERREYKQAVRSGGYSKAEYTLLLDETKRALRKGTRNQSVLAAHLALCDLALNPPILPQHQRIRHGISIQELHPVARTATLWAHAGQVAPPRSLDEAPRYEIELAEHLGWVSPTAIVASGAWHGSLGDDNARDALYLKGLLCRQKWPTVFYDPRLVYSQHAAVRTIFESFDFSIVQCDDGTVFPAHARGGFTIIKHHLMNQWHRQLFLGEPERLTAPLGTPPALIQEFCDQAEALLTDELGGHPVNGPVVYPSPRPA